MTSALHVHGRPSASPSWTGTEPVRRLRPRAGAAFWCLGIALAVLALLLQRPLPGVRNPELHLVVGVVDTCIAGFAALMAHGRSLRTGRLRDALLSVGLRFITASGVADTAVHVLHRPSPLMPLVFRVIGVVVILVAALSSGDSRMRAARSSVLALGGLGATTTTVLIGLAVIPRVPLDPDGDASALERLVPGLDYLRPTDAVLGCLLVVASAGFWLRGRRSDDAFLTLLGGALALGAAARFDWALFPELHTDLFSTGDVLRTGCYALILLGAFQEGRQYWLARAQLSLVEDRKRIARELHDGVVQELAYLRLEARSLDDPTAERIAAAADRAIDESRGAVQALTDAGTDRLDIALRSALGEMAGRYGFRLDIMGDALPIASADERHGLIRIAREAVGNAARHGGASTVRVTLTGGQGSRGLEIVDDGCGFDRDAVQRGFGLRSMRERATALGGEWGITSEPGRGTTIRITW